jgi:hypothetical protein
MSGVRVPSPTLLNPEIPAASNLGKFGTVEGTVGGLKGMDQRITDQQPDPKTQGDNRFRLGIDPCSTPSLFERVGDTIFLAWCFLVAVAAIVGLVWWTFQSLLAGD